MINSDIFGAGRMMYGMAQEGQAPKSFMKLTRNGVPWMTVLVMSVVLLLGVVLNYLIPEKIFVLIASYRDICHCMGLVDDLTFSSGYASPNEC